MSRLGLIADIHLGAHLRYEDNRLAAQRDVVKAAFELFVQEECDAVLIGGDIFQGPKPETEHYEAFLDALTVLGDTPAVAILGNGGHDAATRQATAPSIVRAPNFEFHAQPGIRVVGDTWVVLLPWAPTARLVASQNGGDRDAIDRHAAEHLLSMAAALRSKVPVGCASVLLTHFAISGDQDGLAGLVREPVLPLEALEALGYDAVVAGHFHRPQLLSPDLWDNPQGAPILFCGSPYPLNFGEEGYDHGVWLLDVEPGHAVARFVRLDSRPFVTVDVDLTWLPVGVDPTGWLIGHVEAVTA